MLLRLIETKLPNLKLDHSEFLSKWLYSVTVVTLVGVLECMRHSEGLFFFRFIGNGYRSFYQIGKFTLQFVLRCFGLSCLLLLELECKRSV